MIAMLVRSIFEQPDRDATWNQLGDVVDRLSQAGFCDQAVMVLDAAETSWRSARSRSSTGPRSARTTPRND